MDTTLTPDLIQIKLADLSKQYEDAAKSWREEEEPEQEKFFTRKMRMVDSASAYLMKLNKDGFVLLNVGGRWLLPSGTQENIVYRTTPDGCNCEAGMHGKLCKHSVLALAIEMALNPDTKKETP